jgi:hypothetical protein
VTPLHLGDETRGPIREHLKAWQEQYVKDNPHMLHELPGFGMIPRETLLPVTLKGMEQLAPDTEDDSLDSEDEFYAMQGDAPEESFFMKGDLVQIKACVSHCSEL